MSNQIKFSAPVELQAAPADGKRASFVINAYNGGVMTPAMTGGTRGPVVIDLAGVTIAKASGKVPILFSHDETRVLGHGIPEFSDGIKITGELTGEDAHTQSVIAHGKNGFEWEASVGGNIGRTETLKAGKKATVNGRQVTGPLTIIRGFVLSETSILAYGADSGTSAAIAASHSKESDMDPQFKAWLEANEISHENLSAKAQLKLEAQWRADTAPAPRNKTSVEDVLNKHQGEADRRQEIAEMTASYLSDNPGICSSDTLDKIRLLAASATDAGWSPEKYHYELLKAGQTTGPFFRPSVVNGRDKLNDVQFGKVLEAALCQTGRLHGHEKMFDDQTLQAAHTRYPQGIGLKQLILQCAERNGYRADHSSEVTLEAQRTAFGMVAPNRMLQAAGGFSMNVIATIIANTANKFMTRGFNSVDTSPLRLARIRSVRDFKQITTVSLIGDLIFQKLGPAGEIKHGNLGETTYTNQADTYARMNAITRQDIINDDTGALTDAPMKLGIGGGRKLADIFWTAFLGAENAGFFASGNANLNTGVADMTIGGLTATEVIFMNQTDPNGYPMAAEPRILVVPSGLKATSAALMDPQSMMLGSAGSNTNPFKGRFRVESSPYMSNSTYTGYSATAWYMLADPDVSAMIEIVALNGKVEPTVEQADADFNVLGIQMRGYSDIGVALQEKRAAVKADGGAS